MAEKDKKGINGKLFFILIICIFLRIILFIFQSPFNNDAHFPVVQYIFQSHNLPTIFQFDQAQHPPLYYIIASFFLIFGSEKAVQFFSLLLSIGALIIFFILITKLEIKPKTKIYCLLFAGILPQFIFFGNYISNDSLAIFLGSLIFFQIYKLIKIPTLLNHVILALILGLGMLTKATFILFLPILLILIIFINVKNHTLKCMACTPYWFLNTLKLHFPFSRTKVGRLQKEQFFGLKNNKKILIPCLIFLIISLTLGGYKYINNEILYKNPLFNAQDINPDWFAPHRGTYQGLSSFYDVNLIKLLNNPYVSEETKHSYPLMLYGTLWYQYIKDSNFNGSSKIFEYLGTLIYIFAIIPTLILIIGTLIIIRKIPKLFKYKELENRDFLKISFEVFCVLLFLANFSFIFYAGLKYDDWAFFQSRYTFPSMFALLIMLNSGLEFLDNHKTARKFAYLSLIGLFILFLFYLAYSVSSILKIV